MHLRYRPSLICRPSSTNFVNSSFLLSFPLLLLLVPCALGGTWLSFNQDNGGIDGGLTGALRGTYTAEARSSGALAAREGEQLIGLLRLCHQKPLKRSQHNLDELCSALFQMAKEQRRRKRRDVFAGEREQIQLAEKKRSFLPIEVDNDDQFLWW